MAIFTALASAIGLIGLTSSRSSWGQEPPPSPPGFTGGAKPFSNPFAPGATPPSGAGDGNDFFDDELPDEEDFDFPPPPGAGAGNFTPPARNAPNFNPGDSSGADRGSFRAGAPNAGSASGSISMGGAGTGVVSTRPQAPINIDTETGDGSKETVTDFNFPDADILDIAKTLGKLTGKNFILDKDVKGRISIVTNSPITIGDA